MTNGRIWLVVNPTVGVPLFFAGVALTALTVHFAILNHTTWFGAYWQGGKTRTAEITTSPSAQVASLATVQLAAAK
jgi:light-harvesting protein B-800-850 alpha chain